MAIISSVALGKVQKSVGNVTFQTYYGKTVAKQKVVRNPNYVPSAKQQEQRDRMYYAFKFANAWDGLTDMLFVRSKWGTKRNNFLKLNYPAIAEYVKNNQTLLLPASGNFVNLLYTMVHLFSTSNLPAYVAKGVDASVNCETTPGTFADGKTNIQCIASIVDALYTKAQMRILYFSTTNNTAPYAGSSPILSTAWNDLTLADGKWTSPVINFDVPHTAAVRLGLIYQIMVDDMPVTINAAGSEALLFKAPALLTELSI